MKFLKKRSLWISGTAGLAFFAVIYPYYHNMYVAEAFTWVCAIMNLFSAVVFAVLLYLKLEGKFPLECSGSVVMSLLVQIPGHALFAAINWGSWVCLGLTGAMLLYCWFTWRHSYSLTMGQKKRLCIVLLVLLMLCGCVFGYYSSPVLRVRVFLMQYQDMLEARIQSARGDIGEVEGAFLSDPMPVLCGIKSFDVWPGEQGMIEFHLFGGTRVGSQIQYYGCYYSWEDVPLAFHNASLPLTAAGSECWIWQGEGDNHGATQKLRDHWYYFEASF